MLKISDILKKANKNKPKKEDRSSADAQHPPQEAVQGSDIKETGQNVVSPRQEDLPAEPVRIEETTEKIKDPEVRKTAPAKKAAEEDDSHALELYNEAIGVVQGIMSLYEGEKPGAFNKAKQIIRQFVQILNTDENSLLRLFFADYHTEKGYLFQHCVNVCVLCLKLGISLNYDFEHLTQLGLAALVHDIGAKDFDEIISRPAILSDKEFMEVRKHPIVGKDILKNIAQDLNFEIFDVVHQEHERVDGSGYPYGLKSQEICDYAKLIGVVDVYEALCHARPYRKKYSGVNVVREMITLKSKFEAKYLKLLIDSVGVFPLLSEVKLNTREIAVVQSQNPQMPFRPLIKVVADARGQELVPQKMIDLKENFSVYIQDVFEQSRLK